MRGRTRARGPAARPPTGARRRGSAAVLGAALCAVLCVGVAGAASAQEPAAAADPAPPLPADRAELHGRLDRLLSDPGLDRAHVGLVVQDAESGEVLFDRNGERRFTAASVTKLVTSAVALHHLGPDHRWRTRLLAAAPPDDGTLRGDLWIVGGGDPTLTREELREWAELLRRAGVRRIGGDLVGDDRVFGAGPWGRGWMWEDVHSGWGAGVTGLHLSPGRVSAELRPGGEVGDAATFRVAEGEPAPAVDSRVRTGPPGSDAELEFLPRAEGAGVTLVGWVPVDRPRVPLSLAPQDPTRHLLHHLGLALAREGIAVEGGFRRPAPGEAAPGAAADGGAAPGARAAADGAESAAWSRDVESEPLEEVLEAVLGRSDNQAAEALLRTLGLERGRRGTAAEGLAVIEETLAEWGIPDEAAALADGSGLSRYTELAPAALVRLLRRAWQLPDFEALRDALPVAAESGTLAGRLLSTEGGGNVRAKTGSLSGVRALAGYVEDADDETLVFALMLNGYASSGAVATALEDLLVEQLALYHGPSY